MNDFKWRHYRGEVILWAVRWYCRHGISYRNLEEMLAERGVEVDHTTLYRWVQHYAPLLRRHHAGSGRPAPPRTSGAGHIMSRLPIFAIDVQISAHRERQGKVVRQDPEAASDALRRVPRSAPRAFRAHTTRSKLTPTINTLRTKSGGRGPGGQALRP